MDYKNWYCVQVASGCEKKARADLLARKAVLDDRFIKGVEVPESTELKVDKSGKRRVIKTKVLPGYILVQVLKEKFEDEEGNVRYEFPAYTQETINKTFNVLGFAGMNKTKPRMMKPQEVKSVFDRVDDTHLEVKKNVQVDYEIGDILEVIDGPFTGHKCEVVNIQGSKILGQLDMFGRIIPAEFTKEQVYKK
jgi:transcriptional antiterminator NusG